MALDPSSRAPTADNPAYLLIGNGRLSRHCAHFLTSTTRAELRVWSRGEALAPALEWARARDARTLFLVSDRAIPALVGQALGLGFAPARPGAWIHCSGSLEASAAAPALRLHPLQTFGAELYAPDRYREFAFVTDADPADVRLPGWDNAIHRLDPARIGAYHAWASLAGNLTTLLWEAFSDRQFVPPSALLPYLERVSANLARAWERGDGASVLTGPLARGDAETLARQLLALRESGDPAFADAYAALARTRRPRGDLPHDAASL